MTRTDDFEQLIREIAADLAEAWVECIGATEGFAVWDDDGDVRAFTEEAQDRFDAATNRLESALRQYVADAARNAETAPGFLEAALADIAEPGAVETAVARLAGADQMNDFGSFLQPGYDYVWKCLADSGEFPPFGRMLSSTDRVTTIMPDDGSPETLDNEIKSRVSAGCEVVALFTMADVETEVSVQRVVAVHIEVARGVSKLVLTPFENVDGELRIGQPMTRDEPRRYLAAS